MSNERPVKKKASVSRKEIKNVISRISRIPFDELQDDFRFREDLGVDSIMAMEIIATFEVKYDFDFDVDKYACIDEVGEFIDIVQENSAG